jgi:hypothetical protein
MDTERINLPLINTGLSNNLSSLFNTKTLSGSHLGTIKLTGKMSLKTTFDALDLIPELEELNKGKSIRTENILKKSKFDNSRYEQPIGTSIDLAKFSAHILKSQNWGNKSEDNPQSFYSSSFLHPKKLGRMDIIKEVGKLKFYLRFKCR